MKQVMIFILLLLSLCAYSQKQPKVEEKFEPISAECEKFIYLESDEFSDKESISSVETLTILDKEGLEPAFSIYFLKVNPKVTVVVFKLANAGCVYDNAEFYVIFKNGGKLQFTGNNKFACDKTVTLYLGGVFGNQNVIDVFKQKEVKAIRILSKGLLVDGFLGDNETENFKAVMNCLYP